MAKKSGGASLRRVFDAAANPVYVVDAKRRLAFCNPAFTEWCGYSFAALAERRLDYHSAAETPIAQFAAALCPPPTTFEGQRQQAPLVGNSASGDPLEAGVAFVPIGDGPDIAGVIGFVEFDSCTTNAAATEPAKLHAELTRLRRDIAAEFRMDRLLGVSAAIRKTRRQIQLAAGSDADVVVVGPRGSGREHVARTIYYGDVHEERGMLVPLSCEILDAELLNTTIDAMVSNRDIESDAALLLLEADQLTESCQDALAHWLLESESPPRTIASARTPLEPLAETNQFRPDLAAAMSTLIIEMPPLSARREDIAILAQAFLEESNRLGGAQRGGFSEEAMDRLIQHEYPENVDDLRRVVLQAAAQSRASIVEASDLPHEIRWGVGRDAHPRREFEEIDLDRFLHDIEQELIARAMAAAKGNRAQAAKLLGVSRAKLLRRLAGESNATD